MAKRLWDGICIGLALFISVGVLGTASAATAKLSTVQQYELKSDCLSATIRAINLEIRRHQQWIDWRKKQGNERDLLELTMKVKSLKRDLEKYRNMDVDDYVLPEKVRLTAWVASKADNDSLLQVEGMSKMGPFYHLAGIVDDDYAALRVNEPYTMTFYKVYPRSYWYMESDYIYIAEFRRNG